MSNLRELRAAMPADFVSRFKETADSVRNESQAACSHLYMLWVLNPLSNFEKCSRSLPSEPPPVSAEPIAEKVAGSRVAAGDGA
jgi:hypothetical protein